MNTKRAPDLFDVIDTTNADRAARELRENDQDHEWYPTTDEIRKAMWQDLRKVLKKNYDHGYFLNRYGDTCSLGYASSNQGDDNKPSIQIESMLDIGTGDGRVFDSMLPGTHVKIARKYGIEKAELMADKLIRKGVWLLGREYMQTTLIDKKFDIVFSNPPYSMFKRWTDKLLNEVSAKVTYLVIPQRWKDDPVMRAQLSAFKVVGSFDFLDGDREARAKVDLLRRHEKASRDEITDSFRSWVKDNIGEFKADPKPEIKLEREDEGLRDKVGHRKDAGTSLIESYNERMQQLVATYKAISAIDFGLLQSLGISYDGVVAKIHSDITSTKYRYWQKAFDHIGEFKRRLTYSMARKLLEEMKDFKELDFNADNIRNIVIWVVSNFNEYATTQMNKVYDDMTDFDSVRAYKSNDKWTTDKWRYSNQRKIPVKYMLDYRVVIGGRSLSKDRFKDRCDAVNYPWCERHMTDNLVDDMCVVANTLGFKNEGFPHNDIITGKRYSLFCSDGSQLMDFRAFKNGNVHIFMNKDLLQVLNVEVGKQRGWLKEAKDVQEEFEVSEEKAVELFGTPNLQLMANESLKLLT